VELLKRLPNSLILLTLLTLLFSGCYYDVEEELYPNTGICDTTNVTYAATIAPLLNQNCNGCHSGAAPSGNIDLSNYANVKICADNGSLYGSMIHDPNWSQMPKGGSKLDDCTLLKVKTWIDNGCPN
jgi:hypothetical protein